MTDDGSAHEVSADDAVEITPEMIEAGVDELNSYDWRLDWPPDKVCEIFRAMIEKKVPKRTYQL
jgi:hypothetical protein